MNDNIRDRIYDLDTVLSEVKRCPQTYDTILKEYTLNGTYQFVLRRKLNQLSKNGRVCKAAIPGTRFGKVIYYARDRKYHIMVEGKRTGISVYYLFEYVLEFGYVKAKEYFELDKCNWIQKADGVFSGGDILLWI